jgi:hypothetical protein
MSSAACSRSRRARQSAHLTPARSASKRAGGHGTDVGEALGDLGLVESAGALLSRPSVMPATPALPSGSSRAARRGSRPARRAWAATRLSTKKHARAVGAASARLDRRRRQRPSVPRRTKHAAGRAMRLNWIEQPLSSWRSGGSHRAVAALAPGLPSGERLRVEHGDGQAVVAEIAARHVLHFRGRDGAQLFTCSGPMSRQAVRPLSSTADLHRLREHRVALVDLLRDHLRPSRVRVPACATPSSAMRGLCSRSAARARRRTCRRPAMPSRKNSASPRFTCVVAGAVLTARSAAAHQILREARCVVPVEDAGEHAERVRVAILLAASRSTGTFQPSGDSGSSPGALTTRRLMPRCSRLRLRLAHRQVAASRACRNVLSRAATPRPCDIADHDEHRRCSARTSGGTSRARPPRMFSRSFIQPMIGRR